mgnify:CR=1 FL=1
MNAIEILRQRLIELAAAFALLTRLPVHRFALPRLTVQAEAVWVYPVVGAAIGAIGLAMIAGHNLLDGSNAADFGSAGWIWTWSPVGH